MLRCVCACVCLCVCTAAGGVVLAVGQASCDAEQPSSADRLCPWCWRSSSLKNTVIKFGAGLEDKVGNEQVLFLLCSSSFCEWCGLCLLVQHCCHFGLDSTQNLYLHQRSPSVADVSFFFFLFFFFLFVFCVCVLNYVNYLHSDDGTLLRFCTSESLSSCVAENLQNKM